MLPTPTNIRADLLAPYYYSQEKSYQYQQDASAGVAVDNSYSDRSQHLAYRVQLEQSTSSQSLVYRQPGRQEVLSHSSTELHKTIVDTSEAPLLDGAHNIVRFIEAAMARAKTDGASATELEEILEQAYTGFKQGYGEAVAIVEASDDYNSLALDSVLTLYTQVVGGIEALRETFLGDGAVAALASDDLNTPPTTAVSGQAESIPAAPLKTLGSQAPGLQTPSEQFSSLVGSHLSPISGLLDSLNDTLENTQAATLEYGKTQQFSFQLTTEDGDNIVIKANNTAVYYGEYSAVAGYRETSVQRSGENNGFQIHVEGDLDAKEIAAIDDLLQQIMSLADAFYTGNIDQAYDAAVDLGYDHTEIARYALHLRQTQQYTVAASYQALMPETAPTLEDQPLFNAIGHYAQQLLESLNNPVNYQRFDYSQLLTAIAEQLDGQIQTPARTQFHDVLNDLLSRVR
ncbi:MAG: DUF5610 domain-containing protein [Cellvibrionaceae bacterium]|nr:DUF5610 domain-containing protein [Cellvibrionaceae bacterium]